MKFKNLKTEFFLLKNNVKINFDWKNLDKQVLKDLSILVRHPGKNFGNSLRLTDSIEEINTSFNSDLIKMDSVYFVIHVRNESRGKKWLLDKEEKYFIIQDGFIMAEVEDRFLSDIKTGKPTIVNSFTSPVKLLSPPYLANLNIDNPAVFFPESGEFKQFKHLDKVLIFDNRVEITPNVKNSETAEIKTFNLMGEEINCEAQRPEKIIKDSAEQ